jgi:hypothetical protein
MERKMSNPIQLNKQKIESLLNGGTKMLLEIDTKEEFFRLIGEDGDVGAVFKNTTIWSDFKLGQEYYVQEDFGVNKHGFGVSFKSDMVSNDKVHYWQSAKYMQEHQSRIKFKVLSIEVKRVQDIQTAREMESILGTKYITKSEDIDIESFGNLIETLKAEFDTSVIQQELEHFAEFNEKIILPRYKDNPFVFIVEIERI